MSQALTIDDVFKEYIPLAQKAIEQHLPRQFNKDSLIHLFGEVYYITYITYDIYYKP